MTGSNRQGEMSSGGHVTLLQGMAAADEFAVLVHESLMNCCTGTTDAKRRRTPSARPKRRPSPSWFAALSASTRIRPMPTTPTCTPATRRLSLNRLALCNRHPGKFSAPSRIGSHQAARTVSHLQEPAGQAGGLDSPEALLYSHNRRKSWHS